MELLKVESLVKHFPVENGLFSKSKKKVHAVNGIDLYVEKGETLGIVGESGSGKSTLGRTLLRLLEPTSGKIFFEGKELCSLNNTELRKARKEMQMVFQDTYASIDPRFTVGEIIEEGMKYHYSKSRQEMKDATLALLSEVGLDEKYYTRFPYQLSGGQRQRVGIARALALNPKLIVADEPVSALDISVQAQVLNLLKRLQKNRELTYIFISHDLSVVKHLSDRIAVMYMGEVVELGKSEDIFEEPLHPYTKALISAIPVADVTRTRERIILEGDIPSPIDPPEGCKFHTRCPQCMEKCKKTVPVKTEHNGHMVACHLYDI